MEIKDSSLRQILQEYHDSDKDEFSKYEMSVIKELYLDSDSVIDANLEDLKYFTYLEKVTIRDTFVTREMLNNICRAKNLRKINFYNCNISDIKCLTKANICELVIDNCKYEDIYIVNNMECLEDLYLDNNDVIDLKELLIIKRIKKLSLSNVRVKTDEYFVYMNDIEYLRLDGSSINDLSVLLCLDKLKMLVIDEGQALKNKDFVIKLINKGVKVVDPSNRDVVIYYG